MSDTPTEKKAVEKKAVAPAAPVVTSSTTNGLAIASLVTGILAFLCGLFFMGIIFGATAIVLGAIGLKKAGGKGLAIAGIITGAVGALSGAIFTILWIVAIVTVGVGGGVVATQLDKVNDAITAQQREVKDQIAAEKNFKKGETAVFGNFEVKVTSVKRNYVPENSYSQAGAGQELVVVGVSVKNISPDSEYFYSYDLKMNEDGVANSSSYVEVPPAFDGGSISSGATAEGNIVYEVTKDASGLKLQYETTVYDTDKYEAKKLTYTLAL